MRIRTVAIITKTIITKREYMYILSLYIYCIYIIYMVYIYYICMCIGLKYCQLFVLVSVNLLHPF